MTDSDLIQALSPVISTLEELEISHFVGGSVASFAYGVTRSTLDADLVANIQAHHVHDFSTRLSDSYYVDAAMIHTAILRRGSFNLIHYETGYKIDIFIPKDRTFDRNQFHNITRRSLDPNETLVAFIAGAEDMILAKLEWYQLGNQISDRQWLDVIGMLKTQRDRIDKSYLRQWAQSLELDDLLERALRESDLL